jgi:hypothetical protein
MSKWHGYLTKPIEKDSWGSVLVYRNPGQLNTAGVDVLSPGPDKQEGTADDITASTSQGTASGEADTGEVFAPPTTPTNGGGGSGAGGG